MKQAKLSRRAGWALLSMVLLATTGMETVVASTDVVSIINLNNRLQFDPSEIRVKVGDTVMWRNVESYPHTVTADSSMVNRRSNVQLPDGVQSFDSGWLDRGATFRYTFTSPGIYRYVCLPHENAGMLGTVVVE